MAEALIQAASFPASVGEKSGKLEGTAKTRRATQMMWSGQSHSLRIQGFMGLRGSNTLDMMRRSGPDFHSKVAAALSAARGKPSRAVTVAMFERFTVKGISVISFAQDEARRLGHNFVDTEHILLGLTREGTGISAKVLNSMGINLEVARVEVAKIIIRGTGPVALEIPFTARANRVLDFSMEEARELGAEVAAQAQRKERCMGEFILNVDELLPVTESLTNDSYSSSSIGKMSSTEVSLLDAFIAPGFVSSEHLLLGLLREGEGVAARVLENLGADTHSIRTQVMRMVSENTDAAGEGIGGSSG